MRRMAPRTGTRDSRMEPEAVNGPGRFKTALVILRQPRAPWEKPGALRDCEDLGIAYLASSLDQFGWPQVVLDQGMGRLDDVEFTETIVRQGPRVVGYSDNCGQFDRVVGVARRVRSRLPGTYQVIGDHGASFHADELLKGDTGLDAVCVGEGEAVLVELLQRLRAGEPPDGTPGLLTRTGGRAGFLPRPKIVNPSDLPWPKRYVLAARARSGKFAGCTIIGSRGCPYRCSFCGNDLYEKLSPGRAWRPRETAELVDEMESLHDRYGVECFTFLDELFVGPPCRESRDRLFRFCEEIGRRGLGIAFRVTCRADFFDPAEDRELVLALREAGLDKIFFGVENGYPATIALYGKGGGITPEKMIAGINFVRDRGIFPFISFIMFHPFVTGEELRFNVEFIHNIQNSHIWGMYSSRLRVSRDISLFHVIANSGLLLSGKDWGEYGYAFADKSVYRIQDRIDRAGRYFHALDRDLEHLLYGLYHGGDSGMRKHDSLRSQIGGTYVYLVNRLMREEIAESEIRAVYRQIKSLMERAEGFSCQ